MADAVEGARDPVAPAGDPVALAGDPVAPRDPIAAAADPVARLVSFGRELRALGLPVGTGRILTFVRAVAALGVAERDDVYWAGRASLVAARRDIAPYDQAFAAWLRRIAPKGELRIELDLPSPAAGSVDRGEPAPDLEIRTGRSSASWSGAADEDDPDEDATIRVVASAAEVLREKSFADLTADEQERVAVLIRRLAVTAPSERTRRSRPAPKGAVFDVRRTLRRSLRTHGEPFDRAWRTRGTRRRPLVLLLDVSGSMSPYSRALLQFAFAAMATGRHVEVFVFGTRLTRVTRTLRTRDPDRALLEIGRVVRDWEGGTRIGGSLKTLLDGWSQRTALRGAVVVLCSDGLERGDPELLRTQVTRLRRLAHRLVWVNPLKGSPRYEPLARGMAAALPSVDVFLSGHNLERVEELARAVGE